MAFYNEVYEHYDELMNFMNLYLFTTVKFSLQFRIKIRLSTTRITSDE
jgi:hypothetical protein